MNNYWTEAFPVEMCTRVHRVGELALLVKCLPHKHGVLSLDPQDTHEQNLVWGKTKTKHAGMHLQTQ